MIDWTDIRYGVVLGRMQPPHIGHLEYLAAARTRCDRLIIGLTNPDIGALVHDSADPDRSRHDHNPFSYFARAEMITATLLESGWSGSDFIVVPADINRPEFLKATLAPPKAATVYITVYDQWGDRKAQLLEDLGYHVEVLWRKTMEDRITSGTEIRQAIRGGAAWKHLVPGAVARYLDQHWIAPSASPPGASNVSADAEL